MLELEGESYVPLLSELTKTLPDKGPAGGPGRMYMYEDGTELTGVAMYKSEEMAVQRNHIPAGMTFPVHTHGEKEWLICYHGKLKFTMDGKESLLEAGSCRFIPVGETHKIEAIEDSSVIAITIPASKDFPDVRK